MKTNILILLSMLLAQAAFAERYMVAFKNHGLHQQLVTQKNTLQLQSYMAAKGYALTADKIQAHLSNINTSVVKDLTPGQVESLKKNADVLFVEREVKRPLPFKIGLFKKPILNDQVYRFFEQERPWGISAINTGITWNVTSGGAGARVLVLDTGIDRDHPALRPNLVNARDFVGDDQADYPYKDTIGHGTHVAGTIAGVLEKSGFSGVAPSAHILAGRVCAEDGCSNIAIAEGINWGIEQKVDVISMSLGGMWSPEAERMAIKAAYDAGITLVAASGNDGVERVGFPAALPECIAVGAVDNKMQRAEFSQYGPQLAIVAPGVDVTSSVPLGSGRQVVLKISNDGITFSKIKGSAMQGSKTLLTPLTGELVYVGLGTKDDFKNANVEGKIAFIKRGELTFLEKIENALEAKAAAAIVFNNEPGVLNGMLTEDGSELAISAYTIDQATGEALLKQLQEGIAVSSQVVSLVTNYASMDGTSMATPHVSGVVALMKSVNKALTPAQVKEILMGTARKISDDKENQTGAGVVQADRAVRAALLSRVSTP